MIRNYFKCNENCVRTRKWYFVYKISEQDFTSMQFVSVDVVLFIYWNSITLMMKSNVQLNFSYIFSKWFRSNTEQFPFHGRIELSCVCYIEQIDNLLWNFFHKNTVDKSMVKGLHQPYFYRLSFWSPFYIESSFDWIP